MALQNYEFTILRGLYIVLIHLSVLSIAISMIMIFCCVLTCPITGYFGN